MTLEPKPQLPPWVPKTHIYGDLPTYGPEEAVGAILARFKEAGGEPHFETPSERAARLRAQAEQRARQMAVIESAEGLRIATDEFQRLLNCLKDELSKMGGFMFRERDRGHLIDMAGGSMWVRWAPQYINTTKDAILHVVIWDGDRVLPAGFQSPEPTERIWYRFDLNEADTPGWRETDGNTDVGDFYSTDRLAENVLNRAIDLAYPQRR